MVEFANGGGPVKNEKAKYAPAFIGQQEEADQHQGERKYFYRYIVTEVECGHVDKYGGGQEYAQCTGSAIQEQQAGNGFHYPGEDLVGGGIADE